MTGMKELTTIAYPFHSLMPLTGAYFEINADNELEYEPGGKFPMYKDMGLKIESKHRP